MFAFSARRFIQLTSLLVLFVYSALAAANAPTVPASSNGNYTVTWNTYYMFLEEKVGSGSWTVVTQDAPGTKTFSNKPAGSYSYRAVHFSFYVLSVKMCITVDSSIVTYTQQIFSEITPIGCSLS